MYSFDRFKKSPWSLVVLERGRIVFRSRASSLKPLVRFLKSELNKNYSQLVIFDKYIGRAAALLMVLIKPVKVHTPVISEGGRRALEESGIPFEAERQVKYLMGIASEEMCGWEKMALGKTPEEFFGML